MRNGLRPSYLGRLLGGFVLYTLLVVFFFAFSSTGPVRTWLPNALLIAVGSYVVLILLVNFGPLLLTGSRLGRKAQQAMARHDHLAAIQYYTEALQASPNHADYLYGRGQARALRGDVQGALADYTAAIEATEFYLPTAPSIAYNAFLARTNIYSEVYADYGRAAVEASAAIEMYPRREDAYLLRAMAYDRQERYQEAIADLNQVVSFAPQSAVVYNNRGYSYYLMGDYAAAVRDFQLAVNLEPTLWQPQYHLAQAYAMQGDAQRAILRLKQAGTLSRQPLQQARHDEAFARLRDWDEFIRLVGGYVGPHLQS